MFRFTIRDLQREIARNFTRRDLLLVGGAVLFNPAVVGLVMLVSPEARKWCLENLLW